LDSVDIPSSALLPEGQQQIYRSAKDLHGRRDRLSELMSMGTPDLDSEEYERCEEAENMAWNGTMGVEC